MKSKRHAVRNVRGDKTYFRKTAMKSKTINRGNVKRGGYHLWFYLVFMIDFLILKKI